jgi:PAS domain S-box-containing protein
MTEKMLVPPAGTRDIGVSGGCTPHHSRGYPRPTTSQACATSPPGSREKTRTRAQAARSGRGGLPGRANCWFEPGARYCCTAMLLPICMVRPSTVRRTVMPSFDTAVMAAGTATRLEDHLRRIIETQPVCLSRVAADGTFLAVNEAALHMLGAQRLEEVLSTSLLDRVAPDHQRGLADFLAGVSAGERGSTEAAVTALDGVTRSLQVQGVGVTAPVDGLASVLCTFRDVTEVRRLEHALFEGALREEALSATLETTREQLAAAAADAEARQHGAQAERIADLEARLAQARTEQVALADDLELARAERAAALARATRAEECARVEDTRRQSLAQQSAADRGELESLRAAVPRLEAAATEAAAREREAADLEAALRRQLEDLGARVAALDTAVHESGLRARDATALYHAEKARWQAALDEAAAAHDREAAGIRARVAALEAAVQDAAGREHDAIALYEAEKTHWHGMAERAAAHEEELVALRAEHARLAIAWQEAVDRERETSARFDSETAGFRAAVVAAEHGLAAARTELRALDAQWQHASRLADATRITASVASDVETALAMTTAGTRRLLTLLPEGEPKHLAEQALGGSLEATLLARELRRQGVPVPPIAITPVVRRLEPVLTAMVASDASLAILAGSDGVGVSIRPDDLEQLLMLLVAGHRAAFRSASHVSIEIAEVTVDGGVATERAVRPGSYALLALHTSGTGDDLPEGLFNAIVGPESWGEAGPCFGALYRLVTRAGGHMWASREGKTGFAIELYLPRADTQNEAAAQPTGELLV